MKDFKKFDQIITDYLPDLTIKSKELLKNYSSFRIGGIVSRIAFPKNAEQLILLFNFAKECMLNPIIIGNGSNILFPDEGIDNLIISTTDMNSVHFDKNIVTAESGVLLTKLATETAKHSLTGMETLHGIPGTVGGAIAMNAGAYGHDISEVVENVTLLVPEEGIIHCTTEEMEFGYRKSIISNINNYIVLSATFNLFTDEKTQINERMKELLAKRKSSQPLEYPSAGSVFKRPEGFFAGKLIEDSGLKGKCIGGAQVSEKHAGFIINRGNATSNDVRELIRYIQKTVYDKYNVNLETEIKLIEG